ncbi:hypothetical protein Ahy_B08g092053 [Arachis hypogaea]|uniref:At2g35280-like TPR domain-containing protein n=1 Tax=Arachis hypogaea TaxID=3818 RepID=A0A444Y341_ARAHY|nr:hypothetical protein Ahy_B08g092053 [Arachis hypogaea]
MDVNCREDRSTVRQGLVQSKDVVHRCTQCRGGGFRLLTRLDSSFGTTVVEFESHAPVGKKLLARCRQSGHLEVLFQYAVSDIFLGGCRFAGMETMHTIAAQGHLAAQYTVSMVLMLRDDFESKTKGLKTFRGLEADAALTICKLEFRGVIQGTWTHMRRVPMLNADNLVCYSHACPSRRNMGAIYCHQHYGRGWHVNDGDGGVAHIPYVHCRADYELIMFVHLFD